MRELEADTKYKGKVQFTIVPPTKEGFKEEVAAFDMGSHGLVALDPEGKTVTKLPGHEFKKADIEKAIVTLLAG